MADFTSSCCSSFYPRNWWITKHLSCFKEEESAEATTSLSFQHKIKSGFLTCGHKIKSVALICASEKNPIVRFVKTNWTKLIAFTVAWGIILGGIGLMYGFKATALPMSIGLGGGMAFGLLSGMIFVLVKPTERTEGFFKRGHNTLMDIMDAFLSKHLDDKTYRILLSITITVVLAISVVYPYVMGAIFGVFIGNQFATRFGYMCSYNNEKYAAHNDIPAHPNYIYYMLKAYPEEHESYKNE